MNCDHSNYDEHFEQCSDCKMTLAQIIVEKAKRLIECMTLPAIVKHRCNWVDAPVSEQRDFELAIADHAIENYHGGN